MTDQTPIQTQQAVAAPQGAQNLRQYLPVTPPQSDADADVAVKAKGLSRWLNKWKKPEKTSEALTDMVMRQSKSAAPAAPPPYTPAAPAHASASASAPAPAQSVAQPAPQQMPVAQAPATQTRMAQANKPQTETPAAPLAQAPAAPLPETQLSMAQSRVGQPATAPSAKQKPSKIKALRGKISRQKAPKADAPSPEAPKPSVKAKAANAPAARQDRRRSDRRNKGADATKKKVLKKGNSGKGASNTSFQSIHKYLRLTYLTLFTLIVVFGGWTVLAKIQGAVIASGQIAVDGKPKLVQHLEGGIISDIAVKEGDRVEKGQTVLTLDATILQANMDAAETNYFENQALIGRLKAEQTGMDRIVWSKALQQKRTNPRVGLAMSGQEQLFQARKSAFLGEIDQLNQRIDQFRDEDDGLVSEMNFARSELQLVEQELAKMTDLLRQNLVPRSRVTQLERDATRLRNTAAKLESRRAGVNNSIKEAQIQISQIDRLRTEQILTDLRLAQTQADSFSQTLKTVSNKSNLIRIAAPVSGTVHAMSISTVGGVIAPGQEIMQIIPERTSLVIKAQVMPQDMDQVSTGQSTNVIFSAFKQQQAPELDGTVSLISADSIVDKVTGMPYFEVEVTIDDSELPKLRGQTLIPGMPADIFIQTGERSVFDYLTAPLRDTFKKTMRDG